MLFLRLQICSILKITFQYCICIFEYNLPLWREYNVNISIVPSTSAFSWECHLNPSSVLWPSMTCACQYFLSFCCALLFIMLFCYRFLFSSCMCSSVLFSLPSASHPISHSFCFSPGCPLFIFFLYSAASPLTLSRSHSLYSLLFLLFLILPCLAPDPWTGLSIPHYRR